jgi:hypothetical protein
LSADAEQHALIRGAYQDADDKNANAAYEEFSQCAKETPSVHDDAANKSRFKKKICNAAQRELT